MDENLARKLQQVGLKFALPGPFFNYEEIFTGNVNHTYRADYIRDDGTGMARITSYLVQRVNTYAFRDPAALMDNIDRVTGYIQQMRPEQTCLKYHHTQEGKTYLFDGDEFWRVCNYVPSVTFDKTDDLEIMRSAAQAFGDFQMILNGFDVKSLAYTIPDFHNTRRRYETLIKDAEEDRLNRVRDVKEELDYLLSVQDLACTMTDMEKKGELPLRVTHNDTKINNVLFDEHTGEALCVVDLDTVMPGFAGHDFGDAVRSAANSMGSSSLEFDKGSLDLDIFRAFAEGFLSATGDVLTEDEKASLAPSCLVMALELSSRYLDDYLTGDRYFGTKYPTQKLDRARNQIALAKDMDRKMAQMQAIVKETAKR